MGKRMNFIETPITGAYVIELESFQDERGLFTRAFCQKEFEAIGFHKQIVQINHSVTIQKGTIRGMHYQLPPACETKIIRCVQGKVLDIMVDLRANSSTFMKWHGVELSKENQCMAFIPDGFAHGFQTLTDNSELIYLSTEFYNMKHERGLRFNDPTLEIKWPLPVNVISAKDKSHPFIDNNFKGIKI